MGQRICALMVLLLAAGGCNAILGGHSHSLAVSQDAGDDRGDAGSSSRADASDSGPDGGGDSGGDSGSAKDAGDSAVGDASSDSGPSAPGPCFFDTAGAVFDQNCLYQ